MGRHAMGKQAMSGAERVRKHREKLRMASGERVPTTTEERLRRDNARLRDRVKEIEAHMQRASGCIPDALWRDLMRALHPDRTASDAVHARAFDGLHQREKILRGRR